jgi:FkbM family methyltransferase
MLKYVGLILSDAAGLVRVCGASVAFRWLLKVLTNFGACRREGNLQPADRAMGEGPFVCTHRSGAKAKISGPQAISGIREIWVRDVYLEGGFLTLPREGVVVDLGANMGNFSMLALGAGPGVRVVSVEPERMYAEGRLLNQLRVNGWESRCTIVNAFVGGTTAAQQEIETSGTGGGVPHLTEAEFVERAGITDRIDLLKCDIEGSEFDLLRPGSRILAITRQIAMEAHKDRGDVQALYKTLEAAGFEVRIVRSSPNDDIVQARKRA